MSLTMALLSMLLASIDRRGAAFRHALSRWLRRPAMAITAGSATPSQDRESRGRFVSRSGLEFESGRSTDRLGLGRIRARSTEQL